jgi:hypothetical protein
LVTKPWLLVSSFLPHIPHAKDYSS